MSTMRRVCVQVIARKARIKSVALLNVLFYKWLGFPAGISGWDQWLASRRCHHRRLSSPRMSEHGGLFSKVKCQMLSIPNSQRSTQRTAGGSEAQFLGRWWKNTISALALLWRAEVVTTAPWQPYYQLFMWHCYIFALYSAGQNSAISVCKQGFQNKRLHDSLVDNEKALLLIVAK